MALVFYLHTKVALFKLTLKNFYTIWVFGWIILHLFLSQDLHWFGLNLLRLIQSKSQKQTEK